MVGSSSVIAISFIFFLKDKRVKYKYFKNPHFDMWIKSSNIS